MYVMFNFNHERWYIVAGTNAANRLILAECFKWANQRMVFGKKLIEQPVIRGKLAIMAAQIEAVQAWTEQITHQMNVLSHEEQSVVLAGPIALLKILLHARGESGIRRSLSNIWRASYHKNRDGTRHRSVSEIQQVCGYFRWFRRDYG